MQRPAEGDLRDPAFGMTVAAESPHTVVHQSVLYRFCPARFFPSNNLTKNNLTPGTGFFVRRVSL